MSKVEKEKLMQLAGWIKESRNIVVFTGAGISTESGIPDFRSPGGIWSRFDPSELTYQNFVASPAIRRKFWEFYRENWKESSGAQPNSAHRAVAALERQGKLTAVITQNIDRLHQAAGNSPAKVLELHGTMWEVRCLSCNYYYPWKEIYNLLEEGKEVGTATSAADCLSPPPYLLDSPFRLKRFVRHSAAVWTAICLFASVPPWWSIPRRSSRKQLKIQGPNWSSSTGRELPWMALPT